MPDHPVTAVGRLLQPKHGEPRILNRIAGTPDRGFRIVTSRTLQPPVGEP